MTTKTLHQTLMDGARFEAKAKRLEEALRELIEDFRKTKCTQAADVNKRVAIIKAESVLKALESTDKFLADLEKENDRAVQKEG